MAKLALIDKELTRLLQRDYQTGMHKLSRQTGVEKRWLFRMRAGEVTDPGVRKVQIVYEHITQTKLVA